MKNENLIPDSIIQLMNQGGSNYNNELILVYKKLALQIEEGEKHTAELFTANVELAFQNQEKENRAAELVIANKELAFQNHEKENRAAELVIANKELLFQNQEKEKRAAELAVANKELIFQNQEKEKRATELVIANKELIFQNQEKEKRAAELVIANKELAFQNQEKEKRAAELVVANKELAFQNQEKEKRAAELVIANKELVFQNQEKEKRAAELILANKELESFTYISSHDLQEPLRKIQMFSNRILLEESKKLSQKGVHYFERIEHSALHMQTLINDLLAYSRTTETKRKFEKILLNEIVAEVMDSMEEELQEKDAIIEITDLCEVTIIPFQFRQLLQNLITNSLKFCMPEQKPYISITCRYIDKNEASQKEMPLETEYYCINFSDKGIGFDSQYKDRIFEIFQRLNDAKSYEGTGIGLTIVKKIVENHNGIIIAKGEVGTGATFEIYIPVYQNF